MPHVRAAILLFLCVGACASTPPPEPRHSTSIGSTYSLASPDVPRRHGETGVAMATDVDAALVVRPDAMMMEVGIHAEDASVSRALARTQAAATDLVTRLQQVTSGASTLTMCGTRVQAVSGTVSKVVAPAGARTDAFEVTLEGRIEIALAPELDYWKRSALVLAVAELADSLEAAQTATKSGGKDGVTLSHMRVIVKDPESYRGKLTELWVQRSRVFAAAAQAHEAPLYLLDCAPPGDIVQKERSLEEITLSLSVSCRLGSVKAAAGH